MIVGYKGPEQNSYRICRRHLLLAANIQRKKITNIIFCIPEQLTYAFEESEKKMLSFTVLLFIRDRKLTQTGLKEFVAYVTKSIKIIHSFWHNLILDIVFSELIT